MSPEVAQVVLDGLEFALRLLGADAPHAARLARVELEAYLHASCASETQHTRSSDNESDAGLASNGTAA